MTRLDLLVLFLASALVVAMANALTGGSPWPAVIGGAASPWLFAAAAAKRRQ